MPDNGFLCHLSKSHRKRFHSPNAARAWRLPDLPVAFWPGISALVAASHTHTCCAPSFCSSPSPTAQSHSPRRRLDSAGHTWHPNPCRRLARTHVLKAHACTLKEATQAAFDHLQRRLQRPCSWSFHRWLISPLLSPLRWPPNNSRKQFWLTRGALVAAFLIPLRCSALSTGGALPPR